MYKATISDDRGQDESQVDISGKGNSTLTSDWCSLTNICALKNLLNLPFLLPAVFDNIINQLSRIAGMYHISISAYLWSMPLILLL